MAPAFDPKPPGPWLVDLSHIDLSKAKARKELVELDGGLLPPRSRRRATAPEGPAWYPTPTVAYAQELGYDLAPNEAWVRYDNGRDLDGWYRRPCDACLATTADLGVDADLSLEDVLAAMDGCKERDPELTIVITAIKTTVKGSLSRVRERPRVRASGPARRRARSRRGARRSPRRARPENH